jgi:hypothetical protein
VAIAFRAATTATGFVAGGNPSIAYDASIQTGDQLLLFVSTFASAISITPTGWVDIREDLGSGTFNHHQYVYRRTAQAGDAGNTLGWDTSANTRYAASMLAYSGAAIGGNAGTASPSAGTSIQAPGIVTPSPGCVLVYCWGASATSGTETITPPGGLNNRTSVAGASNVIGHAVSDQTIASAGGGGSTQTATAALSGAWVGSTILLTSTATFAPGQFLPFFD